MLVAPFFLSTRYSAGWDGLPSPFCYCLTVGLIYTLDIKRYVGRLALFGLISQPVYALNADPSAFWENLTNWNIFFTLVLACSFCGESPIGNGTASARLCYLPAVWGSPGDPLALVIGGHTVDWTIFSLLAAPLIFWPTHTGVKINRWFFYIFYPAHLALIVLVKYLVSIA